MDIRRTPIDGRFAGRTALVTGGTAGIGREVVEHLAREGARVAFCGLEEDLGVETVEVVEKAGSEALFLAGNLIEEAFCRRVVEATVERFGSLHCLVNNAFSFIAAGTEATRAEWERSFLIGPVGYATVTAAAAPHMARAGGGAVVNVASISAYIAQPNRWTYNSAKGAVVTMTRCMALDLAAQGIRVNSVSPAWIWTREVLKAADIDGGGREKWEPVWGQYHMLERCGEPIEVAGPILFLLSDDASFITATDLAIDGGYLGMGPEGLGKQAVFAGSE